MRSTRGLTLAEVMIAALILAMTVWSLQTLYVGLMRGTRKAETHQQTVATLDTLTRFFKEHARTNWADQEVVIDGQFEGCLYQVVESEPLPDPLQDGNTLDLRLVSVEIEFEDKDAQGNLVTRRKRAVVPATR